MVVLVFRPLGLNDHVNNESPPNWQKEFFTYFKEEEFATSMVPVHRATNATAVRGAAEQQLRAPTFG